MHNLIDMLKEILEFLKLKLPSAKPSINFIKEQISFLNRSPEKYRYSPNTLIFSSMLHLLYPQAYKFIRKTGLITLPHPTTKNKLNSKFDLNPQTEQQDPNFLGFMKKKVSGLKSDQMCVALMMDEIHIKKMLDYKGGDIVGMSYDNTDLANSAYVFMINSIFSKYKEVVHVLPVNKLNAKALFTILEKIIFALENIGFKVIVVVSDNNSINRKAMSFFNNPKANHVYCHPCDSTRPLFFCIDSVHLIKSVRNNWLKKKCRACYV